MKTLRILLTLFLLLGSITAKTQSTNGGFIRVMQLDDDARNIIRTIENERVAGGGAVFTLAERTYVNYIVTNFKAIGVWSKITALYGFVGGTAASHKWNWKDMRNLDAAYRLTFGGTFTHSNMGVLPTSNSSFANTYLNPSTVLSPLSSAHTSFYSGTNIANALFDINCESLFQLYSRSTSNTAGGRISNSTFNDISVNSSIGFTMVNRNSSTNLLVLKNERFQNFANNSTTTPNQIVGIFGRIVGAGCSLRQGRFATIGSGLTDTEAIRMSNIVTFAQGILNRQ